jgi:hypothetical protein
MPGRSTPYTTESYIARVSKIGDNANRYDYSRTVYTCIKDKVAIYCKRCEKEFWQSASTHLHRGTQCPCYSGQDKVPEYYLEKARTLAVARGGKLISTSYVNSKTGLEWQCKLGHVWTNTLSNVDRLNQWCPNCYNQQRGQKRRKSPSKFLEELVAVHGERYGYDKVNYLGIDEKVTLYCHSCEAYFDILARTAIRGAGCWACAKVSIGEKNRKYTLGDLQELAACFEGKLLSESYSNVHEALTWQCKKGHVFEKSARHIMAKWTWCDKCNVSYKRGEKIVRLYFEALFGKPFPSNRPEWLKYVNGFPLELDGFNQEMLLAFEHQGLQHERYIRFFHATEAKFHDLKQADLFKRRMCKKQGVTLIHIPELFNSIAPEALPKFIDKELRKHGVSVEPKPELMPEILRSYYAAHDYLAYAEAKLAVSSFGFVSKKQFQKSLEAGQLPKNLPREPREHYLKTQEWIGWRDFLGEKYVGDKSSTWLPFEEARELVAAMNLRSSSEWSRAVKRGKIPPQIPADPRSVYSRVGKWISMGHWLGLTDARVGTQKPVVMYDIDGMQINRFRSVSEASRATGINFSDISGVCRGVRNHTHGRRFRFEAGAPNTLPPLKKYSKRNQGVARFNLHWEFIDWFPNARHAAAACGGSDKAIRLCCSGGIKSSAGYRWKYQDDPARTYSG